MTPPVRTPDDRFDLLPAGEDGELIAPRSDDWYLDQRPPHHE